MTIASDASASNSIVVGFNSGATGTLNIAGTATGVYFLGVGMSGTGTLNLTGGSLAASGNQPVIGANSGSSGTINVSGGSFTSDYGLFIGSSGAGTLNITGGTVTEAVTGDNVDYIGLDSGSTGTVNVSGGTWNTGDYLFVSYGGTGTLTVSGAGIVNVGGEGGNGTIVIGQAGGSGRINIGAGGTAGTLNAAFIDGQGASAASAVVNFNHTGSLSFAPVLSGTLSVTKSGAGTTILTATNTYTGATTINAGTLLVDGSLTSSAVTVNSGGTLGGSGTLGALATIASGGHLAPGDSPGTLTFTHGLTLTAGAILDFQLGTTSDLIRVSGGTLTGPLSGLVTINLSDAGGFAAGTYTLFNFTSAATSSFDASDFTFGSTISGYTYSLVLDGTTLELTATAGASDPGSPIPEPSTYAAIVGSAVLLGAALRRRWSGLTSRRFSWLTLILRMR